MNRNHWSVPGAALILLVSVAAGGWVAALLLPMTGSEIASLVSYLAVVGALSLLLGLGLIGGMGRVLGASLVTRTLAATVTGIAVPAAGVAVLARLMFVNVEHDLPLLIALLVSSGIASAGVVLTLQLETVRRLRSLSAAVMALGVEEDPTAQPPPSGAHRDDEVARLGAALARLREQLRTAREQRASVEHERAELTAAISHDLRTPLGSIRAVIEAIHDGVVDGPEEVSRYLAIARREVGHLDRMVEDLLDLARFDAGAITLDLQPLSLQEIVAEVADAMSVQAARAGIDLSLDLHGTPPPVPLDGPRVERALGNVLRNAIEHTPPGGRIQVDVTDAGGDGAIVRVRDTGEGIAEADLPRIWERFFRADPARPRMGGDAGSGIGLAVVAAVVQSHGGSVVARSRLGEGTEVALQFPRTVPRAG